jgi:hypothetical protein
MNASQGLNTAGEPARKFLWLIRNSHCLLRNSLHACKSIFDPMIELANEKLAGIFRLYLRGHVPEVADDAERAIRQGDAVHTH